MSYVDKFIKMAESQIGYKESGKNITKYSEYFDKKQPGFFNTKKQGADWCSIFVHWCLCQILAPVEVKKLLGEPVKDNCGAGVKFLWNYMKAKKLNVKEPKAGDIIFFNSFGHVGLIEKVDSKIHTIEGNKGDSVKRGTYALNSSKICGLARIKFPAEKESEKPKEDPKPSIKVKPPVPASSFNKSFNKTYKLKVDAPMVNLQSPESQVIKNLKKGDSVRCYGFFRGSFFYCVDGKTEGYINRRNLV